MLSHFGKLSVDMQQVRAIIPTDEGFRIVCENIPPFHIREGSKEYELIKQWQADQSDQSLNELLKQIPDIAQDSLFYLQYLLEASGKSIRNPGVDGLARVILNLASMIAVCTRDTPENVIDKYCP